LIVDNILADCDITSAFIQIPNKVPQACSYTLNEQGIDKSNEKEYNHFQIFFSITAASGVAYLFFLWDMPGS
jgi:hypothetical protein